MSILTYIAFAALIILLLLYLFMKRKRRLAATSEQEKAETEQAAASTESPESKPVSFETKEEEIPQVDPGCAAEDVSAKEADLKQKIDEMSDEADKEIDSIISDAKEAGESIKEDFRNAIGRLEDEADKFDKDLEAGLTEIKESTSKIADSAAEAVEEKKAYLSDAAEEISEKISEEANKKKEKAENFAEKALNVFEEGKKAQAEAVSEIVKLVADPKETLFVELTANEKNAKDIRNGFVSIDVETTGIDANSNEITSIAAVKYVDGIKVDAFFTNVKANEEESENPDIKQALNMFCEFLKHDGKTLPIVTHFSRFALNFLKKKSEENNIGVKATYFDIHKFSKSINPDLEDHKLNTLCAHYDIKDHEGNDAVSDAAAVGEIFIKMTE